MTNETTTDETMEQRALELMRAFGQGGSPSGIALIVRMLCGFARSERAAASQRVAKLRAALQRAREDLADWGAYAGDYFKEKWDLAGDLAAIDEALAEDERS